jgi:hypothetical protein
VYRTKALLSLVVILSIASTSIAFNIVYVSANGPNDPGSGTYEDPFRRIQDAIDIAGSGDIVEIQPGIYTGFGNYNLYPNGKSITIRSIEPNAAVNTIIDPDGAGRGFLFQNGESRDCILSGLTIRNAYVATGSNGAGIYCLNCNPIISNCIIRDCFAEGGSGGGICLCYGSATVINCTITGNTAGHYGYGGGISCQFSSPTIIGCTINGNTATITGGGIDIGKSEPNIFNCIIINNNAAAGAGINCYYPGASRVVNCTIAGNRADYFGGGVHCWSQGSANIKNTILWANLAPDGKQLGLQDNGSASIVYCDVQGGLTGVYDPCEHLVWGQGNMDGDPYFASFDFNGDPNIWDFHLQSVYGRWNSTFYRTDLNNDGIINLVEFARLADVWLQQGSMPQDLDNSGIVDLADLELFAQYFLATSQKDGWISDSSTSSCVDAGDPNSSWMAEPWPNGKRINMGAYGGTSQASKNGLKADFDVDGYVDFKDFSYLATNWGTQQSCIEDLDKNGQVDVHDLGEFCVLWLEHN